MARYLDQNAPTTMTRFDWIAEYVAFQTRTKAGRELTIGLRVRKVKGGWVYGFASSPGDSCHPTTSDRLYDMIRRTDLAYFVSQAEEIRIAAHLTKAA